MEDTSYHEFFVAPTQPYHRRYEALRAIFVEGRSQKEVAQEFGFQYSSVRQLAYEFRLHWDSEQRSDASPFFVMSRWDVPQSRLMMTQSNLLL